MAKRKGLRGRGKTTVGGSTKPPDEPTRHSKTTVGAPTKTPAEPPTPRFKTTVGVSVEPLVVPTLHTNTIVLGGSIQGPRGPMGETGAEGAVGETGPQGIPGDMGPRGPQGEPGPTGPQGIVEDAPIDGLIYGRKDAGWVAGGGGGSTITVSDELPDSPISGSLWWESDSGQLYIFYSDDNSSQWVAASPGPPGPTGPQGIPGDTGPQGEQGEPGPTGSTGGQGPTGPSNTLAVGTVTTVAPGGAATSTITGTSPNQTLNLGIPSGLQGIQGVKGDTGSQGIQGPTGSTGGQGPAGPSNTLAIGTVTTVAPGGAATSTITGTSPNQTLNLGIPSGLQGTQGVKGDTGNTGSTGSTGATGPPNVLAIGTVTTGAPGSAAASTITGTSPAQTLNLTIPRGDVGAQGPAGVVSSASLVPSTPVGNIAATDVQAAIQELDSEKLAASHAGTGGTAHANVVAAGAAGFMTGADKTKLDGVATGANNYVHPTGDGNLHVPATGTTNNGKVLTAGATAGSLSWAASSGGASIVISDTPPVSPVAGALWWESDTGLLYIYYNDGTSSQWVMAAPYPNLPIATVAEYQANNAPGKYLSIDTVWGAAAPVALTESASTVTPNFSLGFDFTWTMGGAGRTIANPTNVKAGQKGLFIISPGAAGTITTWGSSYKFSGGVKPTLTLSGIDVISYLASNASTVYCTHSPDFK